MGGQVGGYKRSFFLQFVEGQGRNDAPRRYESLSFQATHCVCSSNALITSAPCCLDQKSFTVSVFFLPRPYSEQSCEKGDSQMKQEATKKLDIESC